MGYFGPRVKPASKLAASERSAVALAQLLGGLDLVAQLRVDLVEVDVRARARGEAAVGIEADALGVDDSHRPLHAGADGLDAVHDARRHADAAQADREIAAQLREHAHVTRRIV